MTKHILLFKNKETPEALHIEAVQPKNSECWHVEIWDTSKEYHSLKPFEDEIKEMTKEQQQYWSRYKNKRYRHTSDELENLYTISKTLNLS